MNPRCARCDKTVYPVEKLNCLDKFWHKVCFKCEVCGMTLNMKNYKGYNKLPYCNAHYPTTKHTTVADTPENRRLQKQTKDQSTLQYHKQFEKEKGHYTGVADDPEMLRAKQNMQNVSQIKYAGGTAEMRLGTDRGARDGVVEGVNPHQPGYEERIHHQPPPQQHYQPPSQPIREQRPPAAPSKPKFLALYDYNAADDDEVSFAEGDEVVDVTEIDEGWIEGRVLRTGQYGMIPANYVEKQ